MTQEPNAGVFARLRSAFFGGGAEDVGDVPADTAVDAPGGLTVPDDAGDVIDDGGEPVQDDEQDDVAELDGGSDPVVEQLDASTPLDASGPGDPLGDLDLEVGPAPDLPGPGPGPEGDLDFGAGATVAPAVTDSSFSPSGLDHPEVGIRLTDSAPEPTEVWLDPVDEGETDPVISPTEDITADDPGEDPIPE